MTRRQVLAAQAATLLASAAAPATPPKLPAGVMEGHDSVVDGMLKNQILDRNSKYYGSERSPDGLNYGGRPAGMMDVLLSAYIHPQSRYYKSALVAERLQLAAAAFGRVQTTDGNWNLPITNFNSPPDTAFIMQQVSLILANARTYGFPDLEKWILDPVMKAGDSLARGGMHTPNHRWVACSALAGLYSLYQDSKYLRRIDQWFAEGIDMDADGQYTERSPLVYNGVCNRAFTIWADRLKKPELLEPVRRNLNSMLYFLHPNGEPVTEISRRQDLNKRGDMSYHWLPLLYIAQKDRNGVFTGVVDAMQHRGASVSHYLTWPQLLDQPKGQPAPSDYDKLFSAVGAARIRRGPKSISVLRGKDRFFTFRSGDAIVEAVRFSSSFFGKGQFRSETLTRDGAEYRMTQNLEAAYYQPLDPPRTVGTEEWETTRPQRKRTEVAKLQYSIAVTETPKGAKLRIQASGTDEVPVAVEISLREGGSISGAERFAQIKDAWILRQGHAEFKLGNDTIKIGPGLGAHSYLEVRGAAPRLEGPSIWLTGFTPLDHTIEFEHA